jgi:hypothetical protein
MINNLLDLSSGYYRSPEHCPGGLVTRTDWAGAAGPLPDPGRHRGCCGIVSSPPGRGVVSRALMMAARPGRSGAAQ